MGCVREFPVRICSHVVGLCLCMFVCFTVGWVGKVVCAAQPCLQLNLACALRCFLVCLILVYAVASFYLRVR